MIFILLTLNHHQATLQQYLNDPVKMFNRIPLEITPAIKELTRPL
jgi:hypothetical protein